MEEGDSGRNWQVSLTGWVMVVSKLDLEGKGGRRWLPERKSIEGYGG